MAELVYLRCAATSVLCAVLLWNGYRASRTRLLFWSSVGFAGLAVNNVLLFVDLVMIPSMDLTLLRTSVAAAAMLVLCLGLVWESR